MLVRSLRDMGIIASRAEGDGVVGGEARVAGPESSARGLVVGVRVRVRAVALCTMPLVDATGAR